MFDPITATVIACFAVFSFCAAPLASAYRILTDDHSEVDASVGHKDLSARLYVKTSRMPPPPPS